MFPPLALFHLARIKYKSHRALAGQQVTQQILRLSEFSEFSLPACSYTFSLKINRVGSHLFFFFLFLFLPSVKTLKHESFLFLKSYGRQPMVPTMLSEPGKHSRGSQKTVQAESEREVILFTWKKMFLTTLLD